MQSFKTYYEINEDAAAGAIGASSIASTFGSSCTKKSKKKKKNKLIKRIFTEDKTFDQRAVMSKIKNAESSAEANEDVVGFALEDENDNIIKIYVKSDQAEEFEKALQSEIDKNGENEHQHREIGEVIFNLKNDFDIVNIVMNAIEEDEEEIEDTESDLELEDDKEDGKDGDKEDDEMVPDLDGGPDADIPGDSDTSTKSALDSVIDMMKADAEARKADAESRTKESEAKIAELNAKAAEEKVKKSEEVMDMEAYYDKKKSEDNESNQLTKLAKYKHDLASDDVEADMDNISVELPQKNESKKMGKLLSEAIKMINKRI